MTDDDYIEMNCRVSGEVMDQPVVDRSWPCNFDMDSGALYAESGRYAKGNPYPVIAAWEGGWPPTQGGIASVTPVASYSTDMAAAWQVVEHLAEQGWQLHLLRPCDGVTQATFSKEWVAWCREGAFCSLQAEAGLAPLAICRAALATVSLRFTVNAPAAATTNADGPRAHHVAHTAPFVVEMANDAFGPPIAPG